ncbi:HNH endonuclease domain-containing protein [Mycoplasma sp. 6243]|uniref:HNH endonuclease domain-containing protein n=1 Tax=Mycoplasma sp. 6243 TaxID=3440865 RepID=UPI003EBD6494
MTTKAEKLWRLQFGDSNTGKDYAGSIVHFDEYGKKSNFGWNIEHITPESLGGTDAYTNLTVANVNNNSLRADRTSWNLNGTNFQVKKVDGYSSSGIYDISNPHQPKLLTKSHKF